MWNLKKGTNELIYKTEIRVTDVENSVPRSKGGERSSWKAEIDIYTHYCI